MCFHMELSSPLHLLQGPSVSCSEVNYSQIEKEDLAIILGVRKFHQYLYGKPFVLVTDHKPLTTLLGPKTSVPTLAASRVQRWALVLSTYSYTIEYRPTVQHSKIIHLDFAGPLDGRMCLLVVDSHSKWPEIWEMKSINSQSTILVLKHLFSLYDLLEQIVTDNGPQFVAQFKSSEFLKLHRVKHYCSVPYHPATNGVVERLVKTFKAAMKIGKKEGEGRQDTLKNFLLRYQSTPHPITSTTSAEFCSTGH